MYCVTNFRSKKELKEAVKNGQAGGVYQVGPFGGGDYSNGQFTVEGPHYPEAHRWYGQVTVRDGQIVSAK
jgi:hypothetical protein